MVLAAAITTYKVLPPAISAYAKEVRVSVSTVAVSVASQDMLTKVLAQSEVVEGRGRWH
jgi:hypothetical protein